MIEVVIMGRFTGYPKGEKTRFAPGPAKVDEDYFTKVLAPKGLAKKAKKTKPSPDEE